MKTSINLQKKSSYDPSWIIELVKQQRPERTDIISALKDCTSCRWESPEYAYFNEGLPLNGGALLHCETESIIIIDMTECGKVAGIEFQEGFSAFCEEPAPGNPCQWNSSCVFPGCLPTPLTPKGGPSHKSRKR